MLELVAFQANKILQNQSLQVMRVTENDFEFFSSPKALLKNQGSLLSSRTAEEVKLRDIVVLLRLKKKCSFSLADKGPFLSALTLTWKLSRTSPKKWSPDVILCVNSVLRTVELRLHCAHSFGCARSTQILSPSWKIRRNEVKLLLDKVETPNLDLIFKYMVFQWAKRSVFDINLLKKF